jgi:hypothetical protein
LTLCLSDSLAGHPDSPAADNNSLTGHPDSPAYFDSPPARLTLALAILTFLLAVLILLVTILTFRSENHEVVGNLSDFIFCKMIYFHGRFILPNVLLFYSFNPIIHRAVS